MRKTWRAALAGLSAFLGVPATALAQEPTEWVRPPLASSPPPRAERAGVPFGMATLACTVRPDGRLANCEILEEHPAGYEFGRHALRGVREARLPRSHSGETGNVTFTVSFCLTDDCAAAQARLLESAAPALSDPESETALSAPATPLLTQLTWSRRREPVWPRDVTMGEVEVAVVVLDCNLRVDGTLSGCAVRSERPRLAGFGREAVLAAHLSRLQPHLVDGVAVERRVRITTVFCNVVCFTTTPDAFLLD